MAALGMIGAMTATGARARGPGKAPRRAAPNTPAAILAAARGWYETTINGIVRDWEPRFRFRQFRPWADGDAEEREAPVFELEAALAALPLLADGPSMFLMLAACPKVAEQTESGSDPLGILLMALSADVLERAERLGYFASDPGALRFPDLPTLTYPHYADDLVLAERELPEAQARVRLAQGGSAEYLPLAKQETALAAVEARLAGLRSGSIPCLSESEKRAQHRARCEVLVSEYRTRLEAAGLDASWVVLPGKAVQS